jgi:hypothetical protein
VHVRCPSLKWSLQGRPARGADIQPDGSADRASQNLKMAERLDDWLLTRPESDFPTSAGIPHRTRLNAVAEYLKKEIHPHVEKGAMLRGDGYLTDHGPEHIDTVIRRASELVRPVPGQLTAYEAYLLVMAIHFHDVGNILAGLSMKSVPAMSCEK